MLAIKKWTVGRPGNEANCIWLVKLLHPSQRGRVWSCCNHQFVSMECNDLTQWSDNKMLTSAKHVLIVLHDTDASYMKSTDLIGHIKVLPW